MKHLSKTDRQEIGLYLEKGHSYRSIAQMLGRSPSTISREVRRNMVNGRYDPEKAQMKSYQRRYWVAKQAPRLWDREWKVFREFLEEKLSQEHPWSPEQICGHWSSVFPHMTISPSTVYRFIERWEYRLKKYLPHQRYGWKQRKNGTPKRNLIPNRIWIDDRPKEVDFRQSLGHWEGDTLGSKKGETDNILGSIERKSRYLIATIMPNRKPSLSAHQLKQWNKQYRFKSLTIDNGIEFQQHEKIGCNTFFTHPYSSWEKGQIEYAMRLLRRLVPKKSSLKDITEKQLQQFVDQLNHTPRKCLNWKTPHQVFFQKSSNPLSSL
jgi:transposase, IS30 family